jgi:subtilisin family serine protease
MTSPVRPAWTRDSAVLALPGVTSLDQIDEAWAFGGADGAGVRVAVIDSGVEADHPGLDACVDVDGGIEFTVSDTGAVESQPGHHGDAFGHGTACAGIVHQLAPGARITSVKVLGEGLTGKVAAFHAGLQWAVEEGFDVVNLSLGTRKRDWALAFHEVCDRAYFRGTVVVTAANNVARVSFPSLFASVTSVACNLTDDPRRFHFNPEPPTEFLARGIDVPVLWRGGGTSTATGNSYAAPHIAGLAALVRSKHPDLRPFQVKTVLWAVAANVREAPGVDPMAGRLSRAMRSTALTRLSRVSRPVTPARSA